MEDPIRECVGFRLAAAHRRLDRHFTRMYSRIGLSHSQGQILICLFERGSARMTEIAADTGLSQSTVSRLTKELSRHRFLRREKDPDDARAQLLSPGNRAKTLRGELYRLQALINSRVRGDLGADNLGQLLETLDRIIRHG